VDEVVFFPKNETKIDECKKSGKSENTTSVTRKAICLDQLSLAIPSWVGAITTSQRAVKPFGWGVKASMVRVWMAGKTV